MRREEATTLLKEIINVCDGLNEQAVMLMPPNSDDVRSHGYQLHIKLPIADNIPCIRPLVEKLHLAIAEETQKDLLVIYRPMNQQEDR